MTIPALGIPLSDGGLEARIQSRMAEVEMALTDAVEVEMGIVSDAASHLISAGGKRFRPLLVLLAAEFGDPLAVGVVPAAVVVELTHLATLYHDDVMDQAEIRRGAVSVNARWDNSVAILTGDFLFARASDIVADLGPEAVHIQAQTFARLVQGQIRETVGPQPGDDPLQHYLRVVADKTGSLISTSARLGAKLAGAPYDIEAELTAFGEQIGTAFQLSDDILDVASETAESGKTPGTDLLEGVTTLPTLLARRSRQPGDSRLQELLAGPLEDDSDHAEALQLLRDNPAMAEARDEVRRRTIEARSRLESLPAIPARQALVGLCDLVTSRTS